ncbi:MAG: L-arabinose isomerase, partial [Acholeplasmataceae bacterium]
MMKKYQFWFIVGTQHLYGASIFETITQRALEMVETISDAMKPFAELEFKMLVKT